MLISCAKVKAKEQSADLNLSQKFDFYLSESEKLKKSDGWLTDDCDSLMWSSLYKAIGGNIDLDLARDEGGKWHRTTSHDCYPARSKSEISQDMILALMFSTLHEKNLDRIEKLIAYGENHPGPLGTWKMGEGDITRSLLRPPLQKLAYLIRDNLKGQKQFVSLDFTDHLSTLHLFLLAKLQNGANSETVLWFRYYADKSPKNALFSAIAKRYGIAVKIDPNKILMDESLFPSDRLPGSVERCEQYLWQRDEGSNDWKPCPNESKTHPGIDFLIAAAIVLGKI